ncbi:MAG: class II aldolase/adducin family protein [Thiohalospira sp.]
MDPRADLVRYYHWLHRHGLNDAHSGNASVRDGATVWLTPTSACADTLRPWQLVPGTPEGGPGPGASLDGPLHLAVYRHNPAAGAVLHAHNPHTVALTLDGSDFHPPDFEGQYYFPRVPVLDIPYDEYLARAPEAVAETLAEYPVTVVRGHGVYAAAATLDRAYKWVGSLEQSAHTTWLARQAGTL